MTCIITHSGSNRDRRGETHPLSPKWESTCGLELFVMANPHPLTPGSGRRVRADHTWAWTKAQHWGAWRGGHGVSGNEASDEGEGGFL